MPSIKIHFRTLTDLHTSEEQRLHNAYTLLKGQCEGLTHKPGFLASNELKTLASTYQVSPSTLYGRLNKLVKNGYIQKKQYGYTLTSTDHINNNLNLLTPSKNKAGKLYHPYAKVTIPKTNDLRVIELTKLYLLFKQIINRKSKSNGLYVKNKKISNALKELRLL